MSDIQLGGHKNAATGSEIGLGCSLVDELTENGRDPRRGSR